MQTETLHQRIKRICKEKLGIPVCQLESELGFGNATIGKWDKSSPAADKIVAVANKIGVSTDYLLGKTDIDLPVDEFIQNKHIISLQRATQNMSPEKADRVLQTMVQLAMDITSSEDDNK